ncbi:DUF6081 family protein [Myxococcota bacterium]|nr:DUF6081 family protein [Myxococcota bacterium]
MKNIKRGQSWIGLSIVPVLACTACNGAHEVGPEEQVDEYLGRGEPVTTVVDYENFSDGAGYDTRWFSVHSFYGIGETAATNAKTFAGERLAINAAPFTEAATLDLVWDHMKYFAASTTSFDIPVRGAVMVSADIQASTPGVVARRANPAGRPLLEGQQGAATLDLVDADGTGLHLSWWVSETKAFALYERVFPNGQCATDVGFTQIVREISITPGMHNFAIEYRRNALSSAPDMVTWTFDGVPQAWVQNIGIPLDVQNPTKWNRITYRSLGPGERLQNRLSAFSVGHGIGSMVDEFPFNVCPTNRLSMSPSERAFGQGVNATFDNVRVTTITPASGS